MPVGYILVLSGQQVNPDITISFSFIMGKYDFGGLDRHSVNILRLLSELEGSYQLLKYMGFEEDMKFIDEMKQRYYKLYFKTAKEEKTNNPQ
ncbi:MAG: DUF7212 family protein [Planctomycetota bacterium]